jgi:hypothetical protein
MGQIPAETAAPSITPSIAPTCGSTDPAAASRSRREAYEAGYLQSQWELEAVRSDLRRWKAEAEWWREEYDRLMTEMLEFQLYVQGELGLKP